MFRDDPLPTRCTSPFHRGEGESQQTVCVKCRERKPEKERGREGERDHAVRLSPIYQVKKNHAVYQQQAIGVHFPQKMSFWRRANGVCFPCHTLFKQRSMQIMMQRTVLRGKQSDDIEPSIYTPEGYTATPCSREQELGMWVLYETAPRYDTRFCRKDTFPVERPFFG